MILSPTCTAWRSAGQKSSQFVDGRWVSEVRSTAVSLLAILAA